jgi:hypothetical protein
MVVDHGLPGLTSSPDTAQLTKALVAAQAQFPAVEKGGNNTFGRYKYMRYSDICEALREPLNANGFPLPQVCLTRVGGDWIAVGTLRHASGEFMTSLCPLFLGVDKEGQPRMDMQSLGSAYTYAKKYILLGLVGAWAEDDDDGQKAQPQVKTKAKAESPQKMARGLEIESKARAAIDKAKDMDAARPVLDLVKLRVSERVCDESVFDRVSEYANQKFGGA